MTTLIEAHRKIIAEVVSCPPRRGRKIRVLKAGAAGDAVATLQPGSEIYGLTMGQFSLIDLLLAVLERTGPAEVDVATWIAAQTDMDIVKELLDRAAIEKFRLVVDRSFTRMKPTHCREIEKQFGQGCIRAVSNHSKFIVVRNEKWNIAIRTSMNLNQNPRMENFELSDCATLSGFLTSIVDDIFTNHAPGDWDSTTTNLTNIDNSKRNGGVNDVGKITCADTPAETKLRPDGEFQW